MAPGPHLARACADRGESYLRMLNRDLDDAVRWGERAIELAGRLGERATLAGGYKTSAPPKLLPRRRAGGAGIWRRASFLAREA